MKAAAFDIQDGGAILGASSVRGPPFARACCVCDEGSVRCARLIGTTVHRKYKLIRALGRGGMGTVYMAEHETTGQRVAVKIIHSRLLAPDGDGARRFRREARAASAINCEHIVRVFDAGEDEATGLLYLVMELLDGEDLQSLIDRVGPLDPHAALLITAQALAGLREAHEANIVHRDIKPANLFLARGKAGAITVKLVDFGIAKIKGGPLRGVEPTGLTTSSSMLGSPLYMSPEQVMSSKDVDHRTDIWSIGSVLYCALTGRAPHAGIDSVGRLLVTICNTKPAPAQVRAPWLPRAIPELLDPALHLEPEGRYPTAADMLDAIRSLLPEGAALHEGMLVAAGRDHESTDIPAENTGLIAGTPPEGGETIADTAPRPFEAQEKPNHKDVETEQSARLGRASAEPARRQVRWSALAVFAAVSLVLCIASVFGLGVVLAPLVQQGSVNRNLIRLEPKAASLILSASAPWLTVSAEPDGGAQMVELPAPKPAPTPARVLVGPPRRTSAPAGSLPSAPPTTATQSTITPKPLAPLEGQDFQREPE
jgi:eukaryotic-like serine/threonine-protein kinase